MKRLGWLILVVGCARRSPAPTVSVASAHPTPDPATCLVARTSFVGEEPWVLNCPPIPQPLPADARPCEIREGTFVQTLEYDAEGRPTRIRSVDEEQVFTWADGALTSITAAAGTFNVKLDGEWVAFWLADGTGLRFRVIEGRVAVYLLEDSYTPISRATFTDSGVERVGTFDFEFPGVPDAVFTATFDGGRVQTVSNGVSTSTWTYERGRPVLVEGPGVRREIVYQCAA